ncbi:MAG: hypothetical protein NUV48_14120 [Peptococcaceae bacterium]|jgi:hypothetical protein|nr:hypothetical protein [Peptococcaceae bacterium]
MTVEEVLRKWDIRLVDRNGEPVLEVRGKATQKQIEMLKRMKPEIVAALKQREKEMAEAETRRQAEIEAEKEAIKSGEKPIQLFYHDGEYLSGWKVVGVAVALLEELGLVRHVSGWGYRLINHPAADSLGHEFTYQQAVEAASRIAEERRARKEKADAERAAKFEEARATGQPVLLRQWSTPCRDPREGCSVDIHQEYAMPDGSVQKKWFHTW